MGLKDQLDVEVGPQRDRWGRPMLIPAGGTEREPYSRASSLSDYASGVKTGLEIWKRRLAVVGVARREDIAAMIAALPDMETGDKKNDQITKAQVDEYIDMALEAAEASAKANWGTAVHSFTDGQEGRLEHAPERMRADIEAYHRELERLGIKVLATEIFVACDPLRAAGTFDHLYGLPDGRAVVGDKKTGICNFLDAAIQMAVYASGDAYDWTDDSRTDLRDIAESLGYTFDETEGLYVHIPRGEARCEITELDLTYGYDLASKCSSLHAAGLSAQQDSLISRTSTGLFLSRIWHAKTREALTEIMVDAPEGDDDIKAAANTRWAELTPVNNG